jgi:hypothetical protein
MPIETSALSAETRANRRSKLLMKAGVAAGFLALVSSQTPAVASEKGQPIMVGAFEDAGQQSDPAAAESVMHKIGRVGFSLIKEEVTWVPKQTHLSDHDHLALQNSIEAAKQNNLNVVLMFLPKTWGKNRVPPPMRPNQQRDFCDLVSNVVTEFPSIWGAQIGNEQNNPTFLNQFSADGTDAVAVASEATLARCYDEVKAINPSIEVIGGGLAPSGNDDPHSARPSHSPTSFITNWGAAYKASGRLTPIMDAIGIHPYTQKGETIFTVHPNSTTITAADYKKLVTDLGSAFDFPGSGQEGADLPIIYDEWGDQTIIPANKASIYTGTKAASVNLVTEQTQSQDFNALLQMAGSQPTVLGVINFKAIDSPSLKNDWQSGFYYADGTPKSNKKDVSQSISSAEGS